MDSRDANRPKGLGRYEPPEGSVALESAWRVDPNRASSGYAIGLLLVALLTIVWLGWSATRVQHANVQHPNVQHPNVQHPNVQHPNVQHPNVQHPNVQHLNVQHLNVQHLNEAVAVSRDDVQRSWLIAERGHATAPWVVALTLLAVMGLGTTKRCFGFDRGTVLGFGLVVLFQIATEAASSSIGHNVRGLAVALGAPFAGAALTGLLLLRGADVQAPRRLETARRAIAAFAYFSLAVMMVRAAVVAFVLDRWLGGEGAVVLSAGTFLGAATVAAPWLWQQRSGPSSSAA